MLKALAYWSVALPVRYLGWIFWGLRVEGRQHARVDGPLLVAVTHESVLDPMIAGAAMPRMLRFLARNTLFGPRGEVKFHGRVLKFVGAVPIERDGGGARETLRLARSLLDQGDAVLIFPEGTRSKDGNIQPFRKGVAMIARAAQCPVLPISIDGSRHLWRKGAKLPRLMGGPVRVRIGAPVTYDKTTSAEDVVSHLRDTILDLRGSKASRTHDGPAGDGAGPDPSTGGGASQ